VSGIFCCVAEVPSVTVCDNFVSWSSSSFHALATSSTPWYVNTSFPTSIVLDLVGTTFDLVAICWDQSSGSILF